MIEIKNKKTIKNKSMPTYDLLLFLNISLKMIVPFIDCFAGKLPSDAERTTIC